MIPVLLMQGGQLVKGERFRKHSYVGDPTNAVRIFCDKEVDELAILDISATPSGRGPDFDLLEEIVSEAFMPLACGGGVSTVDQAARLFAIGLEKVIVNSALSDDPGLVDGLADRFGSQAVVVSIDVGRRLFGRDTVMTHNGQRALNRDPADFAREMADRGAGEILLTSIAREGTRRGYDGDLIRSVAEAVPIPVVANGGAGELAHFADAVAAGAAAVAAGSLFVHRGRHRAVLISYPDAAQLEAHLP